MNHDHIDEDEWLAELVQKMLCTNERSVAILAVRQLLQRYPGGRLHVEYDVHPTKSQLGKGDIKLVTNTHVIIVECKYIDTSTHGKTASVRRTKHRKKVREQCVMYAAWARLQHPSKHIVGYVATNEGGLECIVNDITRSDAARHVVPLVENLQQPHIFTGLITGLRQIASGS